MNALSHSDHALERIGKMDSAPPPPYTPAPPQRNAKPSLVALPPHLLLTVSSLLSAPDLLYSFALLSKSLRTYAITHVRSTLLPIYSSKLRNHNSSNPFLATSTTTQHWNARSREMKVLDLFIVACVQESQYAEESELLSVSEAVETDIFGFMQPRARVEDLIILTLSERPIYIDTTTKTGTESQIEGEDIIVNLSSRNRKGALLLPFRSQAGGGNAVVHKVVVEETIDEGDSLEILASRLVAALRMVRLGKSGNAYVKR